MNADDAVPEWDRLEMIFEAAVALPRAEQIAFLDHQELSPELRAEVESLLAHADSADRLFDAMAASLPTPVPEEREEAQDDGEEVSSRSDPLLGQRVGHYLIAERIGGGGMGVLYRARDTRLEREVALKFLPPHLGLDPQAKQRFLVEARAAAALDHPGICTVHEIGETEDGRLFIAMVCYEGETLKERIARGPLPVAEAVTIAVRLAPALAAAHGRGIIHRDVKPANIMLTRDGGVKLLDFGLAKIPDAAITLPGTTPGTVAYMSPEQVRGEPVDRRSDLWALGVVLYEMLAGTRPFRGGADTSVIHNILHLEPPSVVELRPETPPAVVAAVARLLQKDPAGRYGNADELLADLTGEAANTLATVATLASSPAHPRPRRRTRWLALSVIGLAGIVWVGALRSGNITLDGAWSKLTGSATADPRTIAVLPFANVGGDPEHEYLSDGLSEELIAALSRLRAVRVASRTSTFAFKGDTRDIRDIGRALGVAAVLEGSIRHQGDRVRVVARLVGVTDGFLLWSGSYERELTDILAIESDIALRIANALEAELTPADRARLVRKPTESPEAHNLYLKGRYFWNRRTYFDFEKALDYFHQALAVDPEYARAYAGLAGAYAPIGTFGYLQPQAASARMRDAAYRAVELDPLLAEAHTVLAAYLSGYEWDFAGAERAFLRAIELDPSYPTAHHWYGYLLEAQGRFDEALAQRRLAVSLDPLAPVYTVALGDDLLEIGQPDLAADSYRQALELEPGFWLAYEGLGQLYEKQGDLARAVGSFEDAVAHAGPTRRPKAALARVLALAGRKEEARLILDTLQAQGVRDDIYTPQVASALYAIGQRDAAFAWLEEAYRQRHPDLVQIALESGAAGIQDDPRFAELQRRIGTQR